MQAAAGQARRNVKGREQPRSIAGGFATAPSARFLADRLRRRSTCAGGAPRRGRCAAPLPLDPPSAWASASCCFRRRWRAFALAALIAAVLLFATAFRLSARLAPQVMADRARLRGARLRLHGAPHGAGRRPVLDQRVFARLTAFVETSMQDLPVVAWAGHHGMETAFAVTKPERLRVTSRGGAAGGRACRGPGPADAAAAAPFREAMISPATPGS